MKVNTTRFGFIDVDEENIIHFVGSGILGFGNLEKFVVLDVDSSSPFKWLQSLEKPEIAFIICDGKLFLKDYNVVLPKSELKELSMESINDSVIQVIVTISGGTNKISGNLKAPIIINPEEKKAKQIILVNTNYKIKHFLFE